MKTCCVCWELRETCEHTEYLGLVCEQCRSTPFVREREHHYQMTGGSDFAHGIMFALLAEASARVGGWLPSEEIERLQKIEAVAKAWAEARKKENDASGAGVRAEAAMLLADPMLPALKTAYVRAREEWIRASEALCDAEEALVKEMEQ